VSSSIEQLKYHLVWCTKYRYRLLTSKIAEQLRELITRMQEWYGFTTISLAVEPDHVHLLFAVPNSQTDLNRLVKRIKGYSSRYLRKRFTALQAYPALWTASHFLASVGEVSEHTIQQYIAAQGIREEETVARTFVFKVLKPTSRKRSQLDAWLASPSTRPKALIQAFQRSGKPETQVNQIALRNDVIDVKTTTNSATKQWLRVGGGNGWPSLRLGLLGRELPSDGKIKDSKLVKTSGGFKAHLTVAQTRIIDTDAINILAVDLGITHPITAIRLDGQRVKDERFLGGELKALAWKRSQRAAKLQKVAKTALTDRLAKYTKARSNWVHQYTASLVKQAKASKAVLVVGNIRGITDKWNKSEKRRNRTFRKKAKPTPYGRIMAQLWYKGTLNGVQVAFVDEAYTSQICARCGSLGNRLGSKFYCAACKYTNQADLNGAINIALAFQRDHDGLVRLPVSEANWTTPMSEANWITPASGANWNQEVSLVGDSRL
jgi:putative transposase